MKIRTNADEIEDLDFYIMEELDPSSLEPAKQYGTEELGLVDGKVVYRLPAIYVKENGRQNQNISLKVRNKPASTIPEMTKIHLVGNVVITPWIKNNRIAYSLLADGVEVIK
jgi:hypothetical protein